MTISRLTFCSVMFLIASATFFLIQVFQVRPLMEKHEEQMLTMGKFFQELKQENNDLKTENELINVQESNSCSVFNNEPKEEFLGKALKEGLNLKQLQELEAIYDLVCKT